MEILALLLLLAALILLVWSRMMKGGDRYMAFALVSFFLSVFFVLIGLAEVLPVLVLMMVFYLYQAIKTGRRYRRRK